MPSKKDALTSLAWQTIPYMGLAILDRQSRVCAWNDEAERLSGLLREEVVGRPWSSFSRELDPARLPVGFRCETDDGGTVGVLVGNASGHKLISYQCSPLQEASECVGYVVSLRQQELPDSSEAALSVLRERRFRTLLESIAHDVWVANATGEFVSFDTNSSNTSPAISLEERLALIHPEDRPRLIDVVQKALHSQEPFQVEARGIGPTGQWHHFSMRAVTITDAKGQLQEWVGMTQDVSEPKRLARIANRQMELLRVLADASVRILQCTDPGVLLQDVFEVTKNNCCIDAMFSFVGDSGKGDLRLDSCWGNFASLIGEQAIVQGCIAKCTQAIRSRKIVCCCDIQSTRDPELDVLRELGVQSMVCCLLIAADDLLGVLVFVGNSQCRYEDEELAFLEMLASFVAIATQRLLAVRQLCQSEERLREAQFLANIGSYYWDCVQNKIEWTDELYRIYGLDRETFRASLEAYLAMIHPDDLERVNAVIQAALTVRGRYSHEYRIVRPSGEVRWVSGTGEVLVNEENELRAVHGTCQDITQRKLAEQALAESQQRLGLIAEHIQDLFWISEMPEGRIIFASAASQKVLGRTARELVGQSFFRRTLVYGDDLKRFDAAESRQKSGLCTVEEYRIVLPDGKLRWVSDCACPLIGPGGEIRQIVGVMRDVTQGREANERIAVQHAELLQVSRLSTLGLMSAALSHEINQPLSAIANFSSAASAILERTEHDRATLVGLIENIQRQSLRAGEVVRRLRDFGKKSKRKKEPCPLNTLLEDSVTLIYVELTSRRILIHWDLQESSPVCIADRIQIQQVTVNLLMNAADALLKILDRPRVITIRSYVRDDFAVAEIEDSGPGVHGDFRDRIFEPFSTAKLQDGSLGLSICQSIIQDHQGLLGYSANQPEGACFRFSIPLGVPPA